MTYVIGYVQDERYIAKEHMDVRRDRVNFALRVIRSGLCQFCTLFHILPARQGRVVSCFKTCRYVQDERYIAIEHRDEVRPHSGREGGLGHVRRDCVNFAQRPVTVGWVTCYPRVSPVES